MSRWENKYVIGLTGNIAVGKSVVRQMLQHLGAYTIDADGLTHRAMAPGAPAYKPVIEMFGRFVVDDDGRINRARLGAIAFAMPEALTALESIIHPVVNQATNALIAAAKQPVIVVEAIKLIEGNMASSMDAIWVVDASPETQIKRLLDKRGMSLDEAQRRISSQNPQREKLARASVIIRNDGNVEETWKQVQTAWNDIRRTFAGSAAPAQPARAQAATPAAAPARQAAPTNTSAPSSAASAQPMASDKFDPKTEIVIRRGMPGNAEAIANFISQQSGKTVSRMDIMLAFGQKSYLLAHGKDDHLIGVTGWQVENLITRVDEFYIDPGVPTPVIAAELVDAVEDASKELQSEVCFVVLPGTAIAGTPIREALTRNGYQPVTLSDIKFPAWREAAHELIADKSVVALMKQLRADRVMKPI